MESYLKNIESIVDRLLATFPDLDKARQAKCVTRDISSGYTIPSCVLTEKEVRVVVALRERNSMMMRGESVWLRHIAYIVADVLFQCLMVHVPAARRVVSPDGFSSRLDAANAQVQKQLFKLFIEWASSAAAFAFVDLVAIVYNTKRGAALMNIKHAMLTEHLWSTRSGSNQIVVKRAGGWPIMKKTIDVAPWIYVLDIDKDLDRVWTIPHLAVRALGVQDSAKEHFSLLRTKLAMIYAEEESTH